MRILLSNPDSLGDFILRQPFIAALAEAGHSVALVVRDFVAPLAEIAVPGIPLFLCPGNPYEATFTLDSPAGAQLLRQIQDFQPDLLVAASYQYTLLEEFLALTLPSIPTAAMNGPLYPGELAEGSPRQPRVNLQIRLETTADTHEFRKSELFASALLGRPVSLPLPSLQPSQELLQPVRALLAQSGLQPGSYWIVCAGDAAHNRVRNWDIPAWTAFLSAALQQTPVSFVFTGTPDESDTIEQIQAGLGPLAARTLNLSRSACSLDTLIGLTRLSSGYLGRDTGPMHIAAALGRPVLTIFGGGTWPRFIPLARTGAAFTTAVPCRGCLWICHLPEAACIRSVPIDGVLDRFLRIHSGEWSGFEVIESPASETLLQQMVLHSRRRFIDTVDYFAGAVHDLRQNPPPSPELEPLRTRLADTLLQLDQSTRQSEALRSRIRELEAALSRQTSQTETLARLLPALRSEIEELSFTVTPAPPLPPLWQQLLRRLGRAS